MDKKGFTLIELLAVIVILAIIALIATPIVLNIINDAKEQSSLRSAEFYLDAVEMAVAQSTLKALTITDGAYNILPNGNVCLEEYEYSEVNKTYECNNNDTNSNDEELVIEVNGEVPKSGSIYINGGQIEDVSLVLNNETIIKNNKGELVYARKSKMV